MQHLKPVPIVQRQILSNSENAQVALTLSYSHLLNCPFFAILRNIVTCFTCHFGTNWSSGILISNVGDGISVSSGRLFSLYGPVYFSPDPSANRSYTKHA